MDIKRLYYVYVSTKDGDPSYIAVWAMTESEAKTKAEDMLVDGYNITDIVKISIH